MKIWCRLSDLNGRPIAYRTTSAFAAALARVRGLDYPLAIARVALAGPLRLVSTPSRFCEQTRAWLGIGIAFGFSVPRV